MSTKINYKFKCPYPRCGFEFEQAVGTTAGGSKKGGVSSQVICPRCGNFLPNKLGV